MKEWLFKVFRDKYSNYDWAVIVLEKEILWEKQCLYTVSNAANNFIRNSIKRNKEKALNNKLFLDHMFDDVVPEKNNNTSRSNLMEYDAFTDIEFNPKKSYNCQARSAALYVTLKKTGKFETLISSHENYINYFTGNEFKKEERLKLF
ncbi:MAG: DarT1-associated NADAR antitoxin family protein [bacterium]